MPKEQWKEMLQSNSDVILHNSPDKPIVDFFPSLQSLSRWERQPAHISVGGQRFDLRSCKYAAGPQNPVFNYRVLGVWKEEEPVGFCDYQISDKRGPIATLSGLQFVRTDTDGTEGLHDEFKPMWEYFNNRGDSPGSTAYYISPFGNYRHIGLGQTMHAVMLSLLQAEGYPTYTITHDMTNQKRWRKDHGHQGLRYNYSNGNCDASFYGRYNHMLKSGDSPTYSTQLSTYQIDLLRRATELEYT